MKKISFENDSSSNNNNNCSHNNDITKGQDTMEIINNKTINNNATELLINQSSNDELNSTIFTHPSLSSTSQQQQQPQLTKGQQKKLRQKNKIKSTSNSNSSSNNNVHQISLIDTIDHGSKINVVKLCSPISSHNNNNDMIHNSCPLYSVYVADVTSYDLFVYSNYL